MIFDDFGQKSLFGDLLALIWSFEAPGHRNSVSSSTNLSDGPFFTPGDLQKGRKKHQNSENQGALIWPKVQLLATPWEHIEQSQKSHGIDATTNAA